MKLLLLAFLALWAPQDTDIPPTKEVIEELESGQPPAPPDVSETLEAVVKGARGKNLKEIDLSVRPPGEVGGMDFNWPGWTGNRTKINTEGYDGVRILGQGVNATVITPGYEAAFVFGQGTGFVEISNLTIVCGKSFGIKWGTARGEWVDDGKGGQRYVERRDTHYPNDFLSLRNVRVITSDPPPTGPRTTTKWGVHTINVDIHFRNVVFDMPYSAEHALYAHGFAKYGALWRDVVIEAVGAEGFKAASRPWECFWAPEAQIFIDRCEFRNFNQPWSWRGGAGIALAGSGAQYIHVKRCLFVGRPNEEPGGPPKDQLFMMSDGLSTIQSAENNRMRYYDHNGVPGGPGSANGHVLIEDSAFQGYGGGNRENIRLGTLYPGYEELGLPPHTIAQSFTMRRCAFYGPPFMGNRTRASIMDVAFDRIHVREQQHRRPQDPGGGGARV